MSEKTKERVGMSMFLVLYISLLIFMITWR